MTRFPLIGIDIGHVRCGLALSDTEGKVATPLETVEGAPPEYLLERLKTLIPEWNVAGIVAGIPRHLDGGSSNSTRMARDVIAVLRENLEIPVKTWDERFSTAATERLLLQQGKRRSKRKAVRDAGAAAWILQGYLDYLQQRESNKHNSA